MATAPHLRRKSGRVSKPTAPASLPGAGASEHLYQRRSGRHSIGAKDALVQLAIPVRHDNRRKLSQPCTATPAVIKLKQGIYVEQQQPDSSLPSQSQPDALADASSLAATLRQQGSLPPAVQKLLPHARPAPRVAKSPLQAAAAASRRSATPKAWARAAALRGDPLTAAARLAAPLRQSHAAAPLSHRTRLGARAAAAGSSPAASRAPLQCRKIGKGASKSQSVAHVAAGSAEACAAREVEMSNPAKRQRHTAQVKRPATKALPAGNLTAADTSTTPEQAAAQAIRSHSASMAAATLQLPSITAAGPAAAVAGLQPALGAVHHTASPAAPHCAASAGAAPPPTPPSAAAPAAGKAASPRPAIGTAARTPPLPCSLPATSASAARPPSLACPAAAEGPDPPIPDAAWQAAAAAAGSTANGRPRRLASKGVQRLVQAEAAIERQEQTQSWIRTRGEMRTSFVPARRMLAV